VENTYLSIFQALGGLGLTDPREVAEVGARELASARDMCFG
jgi:hypothetical protein